MSYFKALKLTKKGEQLQAKVNGNLSETLVFTRAKLGAGTITSEDEIRFLTDIKEMWGTANVSSCKIEGEDKNRVALELQFSNAELVEDKIFREIGLFAKGNDNEEILYAYANAADKYDYIPLMKDSPHSFIIVISFIIASGTKIDANIDLNSYVSLKKFNEEMAKKANKTDRASTEEYGLTKYGTEIGTALEGNKIEEITGKTYGGVLNEAGLKEAGKTYFDKNTKKLYLCKNNNTDISANINNYIAMDSNSILERLENLIKTDSFLAHNEGWFELFGRVIYYGTVQYNGSSSYTQDFTLKSEIPNWQYANVICCLRETNQKFIDKTFSAKLSNSNKLSVRANLSNAELATVSYLIIARV